MELREALEPGTVIAGKYRVVREIGKGGMGVVLAVSHVELGQGYALKLMLPSAAASGAARERFAREAKAAAKLESEHVARAIDFGFLDDDGPPFMVLELLEGENLAERLARVGPLDPEPLAELVLQACEALREAHREGIVHRDLKPANLFVTTRRDGRPLLKVLDFGIAKTLAPESGSLTKTAMTVGSPFYMSPEQMRSAKNVDARSDVWSLGVTMFELLTGELPFSGESVTEVAINVIEQGVPSPKKHRPDLPDEIVTIVRRCLQKHADNRYPSIDHLARALARFAKIEAPQLGLADAGDEDDFALEPLSDEPAPAAKAQSGETIAAAPVSTLLSQHPRAPSRPSFAGAQTRASATLDKPRPRRRVQIIAAAGVLVAGAATWLGLSQEASGIEATAASAPGSVALAPSAPPPPSPTASLAKTNASDAEAPASTATAGGYQASNDKDATASTGSMRSSGQRRKAQTKKAPPPPEAKTRGKGSKPGTPRELGGSGRRRERAGAHPRLARRPLPCVALRAPRESGVGGEGPGSFPGGRGRAHVEHAYGRPPYCRPEAPCLDPLRPAQCAAVGRSSWKAKPEVWPWTSVFLGTAGSGIGLPAGSTSRVLKKAVVRPLGAVAALSQPPRVARESALSGLHSTWPGRARRGPRRSRCDPLHGDSRAPTSPLARANQKVVAATPVPRHDADFLAAC